MGSNSITGVNLINSIDITSHASRHLPGGSDPLTTGTPSSIGTFSQIGSVNAFSRQDHIHAHGNQPGGDLHTTASTTIAGFMSSNDKFILDNITSLTQSLTNKTIIGTTNYVDANGLKTTTTPVYTGGSLVPSVNQVLMAISATAATWQTPSNVTTTQSGYMSFTDKNILDNITSSTQSLTNKTIIGATNYVDTNGLKTTTTPVYTGGSVVPSINQVLMAISATAATWQTPSNVTATQSGYMSFTDKNILDNITSSTQSLTNKTIVGSTNYVDTNGLKTTTTPVYTGGSVAPSIGQTLVAISATAATWQTPQSASTQVTPVDPATTTSTVGVMMGLGASASITPVLTGKLMIIISGDTDNDTNSSGTRVQIRVGTGTAPINGGALTGTTQGGLVSFQQNNLNNRVPFSLNAIVNGFTLNTALWVDISLAAITSGVARVRNISISVIEL
jgi:ribosomal protein L1